MKLLLGYILELDWDIDYNIPYWYRDIGDIREFKLQVELLLVLQFKANMGVYTPWFSGYIKYCM